MTAQGKCSGAGGRTKGLPPIDEREIRWTPLGKVGVRRSGSCNVLVVSQHGAPQDDANTEILAALLAERLDAFAVVNNRKYNRKRGPAEHPHTEDLNNPDAARRCSDFWGPLTELLSVILNDFEKPPIVLFIHGMSDRNARRFLGDAGVFAIGAGYDGVYDPERATATKALIDKLKRVLTERVGGALDGVPGYGATKTLPIVFRGDFPGRVVEAVQLEIRWKGFRDSRPNIESLAGNLTDILLGEEFAPFVETASRIAGHDGTICP